MENRKLKPTVVALLVSFALCAGLLSACAQQQGASGASASAASSSSPSASAQAASSSASASTGASADASASASAAAQSSDVVVGVAWRPNAESLSYKSTCRALEAAGIRYVLLPQAHSADLSYGADNKLLAGVADTGALSAEAAKLVRCNTWQESDAAEILEGVNAVVFPGGEDVSPTLYYDPQEWHGVEAEKDYSAERDASDFVLMSYCLEHDIPFMTICRGTQMLSIVSGAEIIQDIPTWFANQGKAYENEHKQLADADGHRDFAPNDVRVEKGSILYSIVQKDELEGCPCWHHQAVSNVDGTRLVVSARSTTEGVDMIEAVERTDKTYAVGVQFHPEISIQKVLDNEANAQDYLDYDTALSLFKRLQEEGARQLAEDPQNLGLRPAA